MTTKEKFHSKKVSLDIVRTTVLQLALTLIFFAPKKRLEAKNIKARSEFLAPQTTGSDSFFIEIKDYLQ